MEGTGIYLKLVDLENYDVISARTKRGGGGRIILVARVTCGGNEKRRERERERERERKVFVFAFLIPSGTSFQRVAIAHTWKLVQLVFCLSPSMFPFRCGARVSFLLFFLFSLSLSLFLFFRFYFFLSFL